MKKTTKKVLALASSAVLLVSASVLGTMAYLTSTDAVENTFTVGQVEISLDEAKVDTEGKEDSSAKRVQENTYKLMPGHEYVKDPTVHVDADSEDSWIFVKVENGLEEIIVTPTIEEQILTNGWTKLETNVYYKSWSSEDGKNDLEVFGSFEISGEVLGGSSDDEGADQTKLYIEDYKTEKITVNAYAIQKDGFDNDVTGAWNAVKNTK